MIISKKTRAFLYNLLSFIAFYVPAMFLIQNFTALEGFWVSMTAFVISIAVGPKFQFVETNEGGKIFMKWIFVKGIKEVK